MKWELVPFLNMKIREKYRVEHHLDFHEIYVWHREYIGRFYKYDIHQTKAFFKITSSYDFEQYNEPHVGPKWFPDTVMVYTMVRQGQKSMERRAYRSILVRLIDGIIPPDFI